MSLLNALGQLWGREPHVRVKMLVSVGNMPAGEQFDIPVSVADKFIARGYAEGHPSREFSAEELSALRSNHQTVEV
jgi:hypothetical protein